MAKILSEKNKVINKFSMQCSNISYIGINDGLKKNLLPGASYGEYYATKIKPCVLSAEKGGVCLIQMQYFLK